MTARPLDLEALRRDTPGLTVESPVTHFNNAGAGLMPGDVLAAMQEHLSLEAHIGGYEAAAQEADAVNDFYAAAAELLGASAHNIAFTTSATDAFARALSAVPLSTDDTILTTRDDFISNQIAFMSLKKRLGIRVVHAPNAPEGGVDVASLTQLMDAENPQLVAVTHIPTNSGLVQPVVEIGRRCRERGLVYLVDACQSIGQYPLDVDEIGCDFLSACCRKFLRGPRGTGLLYVSDRILHRGLEPLFIDMRGARWTDEDSYEPVASAARFEDWEFPYAAVRGTAEAIRYALSVGLEAIAERTPILGAQLRDRLAETPGVRTLDRGHDLCAIVTLTIEGLDAEAAHAALLAEGINSAVSYQEFAIYDFVEKQVESCVRLSPHYYNTVDEIDFVASVVARLARHGGS